MLRVQWGPQANKVTLRNMLDWVVRVAALFNPLGTIVLRWTTRPVEPSIVVAKRCLIALRVVKT